MSSMEYTCNIYVLRAIMQDYLENNFSGKGEYCASQELLHGTYFTCCQGCIYYYERGRKFTCTIMERFK
jgi:hypothetical protein